MKALFKYHVLYKGHDFLSYAQLFTGMSFTLYSKGHSIYAGPARARRNLSRENPRKEHIIKFELIPPNKTLVHH